MLIDAQKRHKINLSKSIIIGDKMSDIEAGKSAGLRLNILFAENKPSTHAVVIKHLDEAMDYL